MEPIRPDVKRAILNANPQASPDDIAEYERLLSLRFTQDPDASSPAAAPFAAGIGAPDPEERLLELHDKLFPARAQRLLAGNH